MKFMIAFVGLLVVVSAQEVAKEETKDPEWMTPRMRKDMGALMAAMRDLERSIKNDCLTEESYPLMMAELKERVLDLERVHESCRVDGYGTSESLENKIEENDEDEDDEDVDDEDEDVVGRKKGKGKGKWKGRGKGGRKGGRKGGKAGPRQDKEKKGKGKNKWNRMNRNETVSGEENTMEE